MCPIHANQHIFALYGDNIYQETIKFLINLFNVLIQIYKLSYIYYYCGLIFSFLFV